MPAAPRTRVLSLSLKNESSKSQDGVFAVSNMADFERKEGGVIAMWGQVGHAWRQRRLVSSLDRRQLQAWQRQLGRALRLHVAAGQSAGGALLPLRRRLLLLRRRWLLLLLRRNRRRLARGQGLFSGPHRRRRGRAPTLFQAAGLCREV